MPANVLGTATIEGDSAAIIRDGTIQYVNTVSDAVSLHVALEKCRCLRIWLVRVHRHVRVKLRQRDREEAQVRAGADEEAPAPRVLSLDRKAAVRDGRSGPSPGDWTLRRPTPRSGPRASYLGDKPLGPGDISRGYLVSTIVDPLGGISTRSEARAP